MLFFASWIFLGQADSETFSAALPLSLSVPLPLLLSLLFSLFSLSSSVTLQSLPFCFSFNFRRDYCVIAGDRQSVVVDVSLSFLTDTQPSALFSVSVYPSHPPQHDFLRVLARGIGLHRYRRQHTGVLVAGTWRAYKDRGKRRGCDE